MQIKICTISNTQWKMNEWNEVFHRVSFYCLGVDRCKTRQQVDLKDQSSQFLKINSTLFSAWKRPSNIPFISLPDLLKDAFPSQHAVKSNVYGWQLLRTKWVSGQWFINSIVPKAPQIMTMEHKWMFHFIRRFDLCRHLPWEGFTFIVDGGDGVCVCVCLNNHP